MSRLVIAEPAAHDLDSIIDHIALENTQAARMVYQAITQAARNLARFPQLGRPGRFSRTRELSVPGLPYLIVYEAGRDVVTVLAVFHTARDLVQAMRNRTERP